MPRCVMEPKQRHSAMIHTVKRYGSRKLYDPTDSRYVSMSDLSDWIRRGDQVRVLDNQSGDDVTVQVLTQVIAEEGRSGRLFSTSVLHDLLRAGEEALRRGEDVVAQGVREVKESVGGLVQRTAGRLTPESRPEETGAPAREADAPKPPAPKPDAVASEMAGLRARLDALERSLDELRGGSGS